MVEGVDQACPHGLKSMWPCTQPLGAKRRDDPGARRDSGRLNYFGREDGIRDVDGRRSPVEKQRRHPGVEELI